MTNDSLINARLIAQRLAQPDFASPEDVVKWFGAVQSQDLQASLYALNLRLKKPLTATEIEAHIADRRLLRTWPMRGTIHFVPPEDTRWMLRLLARRTNLKAKGLYKKAGLTSAEFATAREILLAELTGKPPVRRPELAKALAKAGLAKKGEALVMFILGYWAREGLICLGPRNGKQQTFVLLDEWLPKYLQDKFDDQTALTTLAYRYFASHGPATIYDFAWWTGLTITEAKRGLAAIESRLASLEFNGQTYWFTPELPVETPLQSDEVYLLPNYDEFTVAYKDRSAFITPELSMIKAKYGIGNNIIVGGQLAGIWKRTIEKAHVLIETDLFIPLDKAQQANLNKTVQDFAKFVDLQQK